VTGRALAEVILKTWAIILLTRLITTVPAVGIMLTFPAEGREKMHERHEP
jgi:hypothetical protein